MLTVITVDTDQSWSKPSACQIVKHVKSLTPLWRWISDIFALRSQIKYNENVPGRIVQKWLLLFPILNNLSSLTSHCNGNLSSWALVEVLEAIINQIPFQCG